MSRPSSPTARTILVLLTAAAFLGWLPRGRRVTTLRRHVELLQKITPVHQFAPVNAMHARWDPDPESGSGLTVVAQRVPADGPYLLVPVDDRVLAGWLAS